MGERGGHSPARLSLRKSIDFRMSSATVASSSWRKRTALDVVREAPSDFEKRVRPAARARERLFRDVRGQQAVTRVFGKTPRGGGRRACRPPGRSSRRPTRPPTPVVPVGIRSLDQGGQEGAEQIRKPVRRGKSGSRGSTALPRPADAGRWGGAPSGVGEKGSADEKPACSAMRAQAQLHQIRLPRVHENARLLVKQARACTRIRFRSRDPFPFPVPVSRAAFRSKANIKRSGNL
jgi:hypothetical protein